MKNSIYVYCKVIVGLLLLLLFGCRGGSVVTMSFPKEKILTVAELQALPERTNPNDYVVMLEKGDTIPIMLKLESDIASFVQDRLELQLKERLYFRLQGPENMTEEDWLLLEAVKTNDSFQMEKASIAKFLKHYMLFISRDNVHWAPVNSIKALKEVIGLKGGEFSLGLFSSTKSGVQASFTVKTHSVDRE